MQRKVVAESLGMFVMHIRTLDDCLEYFSDFDLSSLSHLQLLIAFSVFLLCLCFIKIFVAFSSRTRTCLTNSAMSSRLSITSFWRSESLVVEDSKVWSFSLIFPDDGVGSIVVDLLVELVTLCSSCCLLLRRALCCSTTSASWALWAACLSRAPAWPSGSSAVVILAPVLSRKKMRVSSSTLRTPLSHLCCCGWGAVWAFSSSGCLNPLDPNCSKNWSKLGSMKDSWGEGKGLQGERRENIKRVRRDMMVGLGGLLTVC